MIGTVLTGRYELAGLLGETAIFSVYSAKDRLLGREVSLRLLRPPFDSETSFKHALSEAVAKASTVQSPSVERLYELQQDEDGKSFIVGDLTRAPNLADRIRKLAPFTSPVAVAAAIGITRGLDAFHKADIVHGEVSAENVAMLADGDTRLQMGAIWQAYSASQTAGAVVLPSFAPYLAPEVSSGGMPSKRSDVYAAGILLFELLTGRRPYVGETAVATAMRHLSEPTPRVRSITPSVPAVLDEIVFKAMSKDPRSRYADAEGLRLDLLQVQDAMRFGRTLSWPLRNQSVPSSSDGHTPVAPRMSAIRDQSKERPSGRSSQEADVPTWMWVVSALVLGGIICMVGVYLLTSFSRPTLVNVPNLTGLSISEAHQTLDRLHLNLKVGPAIPNERYQPDRIIESTPTAGDKVAEHSDVTVTVSSGSRQVDVPDLRGMTPDKARSVLATENLVLDDQIDNTEDSSVPAGTICRQSPAAQTRIDRNEKIHVSVNAGMGAPAPEQPPTNTSQSFVYSLSVLLNDATQPVDVRIDVTDEQGTRTFFDQVKNPGDHIDTSVIAHGTQATFNIYYDGKLVKTVTKQAADEENP